MVAAGEDVARNVMSFVQQHKRAVCILSASGSISDVLLCQPAVVGVNVAYEGRFDIISLSGSFLHIETGGASTVNGRLNICISGEDGRIVGGGVGGPLIAACPVQVIVGSFLIDPGKNTSASSSMVNAGSKMSAPVLAGSTSTSPAPLRTFQDSLGRMTPSEGSDDNPSFGGHGNSYMFHSQGMSIAPSRLPADWRGGPRSEHGRTCLSADEEDEVAFRN
ncbi:uncharacterized protein A4U43_C08F9600 [Asparagus officinalis]|uniref:AT-hook motif nuclear-localized protein 14-like n=1 Tax=Asparagus officinalis TaxID=4686 RepID=UPI00098E2672|nr:AT-hook motif nuclear-localized protein 14-like [Asparagus officinalis]ONK59713.1 uncharacterized protein A4U43_C08F9600 [Asparagus officinalis]